MAQYALRRLLSAIPTLFLIITIAFFMIRVAPGGPFDTENIRPEIQANLMEKYNLDEPLWMQYGRYLSNIATGNFGPSFQYPDRTVTELIASGFRVSAPLGASAILLAFLVGVTLGTIAAVKQNGWLDHALMSTAMIGISIPNFVVAPLLILIFAVGLDLLPIGSQAGAITPATLLMPVVALALPQIAYIARITRGSMIETLHSRFIRTAYAKGLPMRVILLRHALRPALLPVVSYLGPAIAAILTGSVVIEQIFGLPGIGRYFVQGALNRDYTLVMGVVIFYGSLIIVLNFLVDLTYALLDPRVRFGRTQ